MLLASAADGAAIKLDDAANVAVVVSEKYKLYLYITAIHNTETMGGVGLG